MAEPKPNTERPTFSPRTIAWVIVAGVTAFCAFLWLSAYAPEIRARNNGGVHPLSKSAVGFYGLYTLENTLGDRSVAMATSQDDWLHRGLLIVCLAPDADPKILRELVAARAKHGDNSTLYILPKWKTVPLAGHPGWVTQLGTIAPSTLQSLIGQIGPAVVKEDDKPQRLRGFGDVIDIAAPDDLHWVSGIIEPLITDGEGHAVLARVKQANSNVISYILADPDLLANHTLKTPQAAATALRIIDRIRPDMNSDLTFDMTLSRKGSLKTNQRNLLQLMFEPPFLAVTLSVLAAALLVGLHAFGRFGPALPEPRAIPFGKRALADNAAALIFRAGAEKRLGDRYVGLTRDAAALALGANALGTEELELWLADLPVTDDGEDFATLAMAARSANNVAAMHDAARRLFEWKRNVTRDR